MDLTSFQRILVMGCGGSGKSTLSKKMEALLDIEVIHLDEYYWKPYWVESNKEEWANVVKKLMAGEKWILDGNYGGTMDMRIKRADTIIFLNYSTFTCTSRIIKRVFQYRGQVRPGMPIGCVERFDLKFLLYVLMFKITHVRKILQKLKKIGPDKNIYLFKNDRQSDEFLNKITDK